MNAEILTSQKLIDAAMQAWAADKDLYVRSEESAAVLGAALVKVEDALPYGQYGPWLKKSGISVNRASYCVRKVNGKDKAAKDKAKDKTAACVTRLKHGMLIDPQVADHRLLRLDDWALDFNSGKLVLTVTKVEQLQQRAPVSECKPPGHGIVFNVAEMRTRLERLSRVVAKHGQEPVYNRVQLSSDESGTVRLLGIDTDTTLTVKLLAAKAYGDPMSFLLDFPKLKEVVKSLKTTEANLWSTGRIESGEFKCSMQTYTTEHFDALSVVQAIDAKPKLGGFTTNLSGLKDQIEQVMFATPTAESSSFACLRLESTPEALRLVATDSNMMAISDTPANYGEFSYTLPKPLCEKITKMEGDEVSIVDTDEPSVFYASTELELLTYAKTHSEFPPYQKIIPPKDIFRTSITFSAAALVNSLERMRPSCSPNEPAVMFFVEENGKKLELHAIHEEALATGDSVKNVAHDGVEAVVSGLADRVKINPDRLLRFLKRVSSYSVTLCVRDSAHVLDFHANGGTQQKPVYRLLLMPMRLDVGDEITPAEQAAQDAVVAERAAAAKAAA